MNIDSRFNDVIQLTRELVQINSENPNEKEIQDFLCKILESMGFEYDLVPYAENRNNIIAFYPPLTNSHCFNRKYIVFSGHQDTVPGYKITQSMDAPIKEGKMYGRGTSDMKGGIAAFLTAIRLFIKDNIHIMKSSSSSEIERGICIILTVDEEAGCGGVKAFANYKKIGKDFTPDLCILAEPTGSNPVIGHKGVVWFTAEFKGKAAHSSVPYRGDNAIEKASRFINALKPLQGILLLRKIPEYPELDPPTIAVTMIQGGNAVNIIPDTCSVEIDRRINSLETVESARSEIIQIIQELGLESDANLITNGSGNCYILPDGSKNEHYCKIKKITDSFEIKGSMFMNGYTEADVFYNSFNIPTINLGPGNIEQAHKSDEYIEISNLIDAVGIYYQILQEFVIKKKITKKII